ncbi:hypothetical protein O5699_03970 [Escherichia coli]|nr:hypothetical protein [Escherichia coli]
MSSPSYTASVALALNLGDTLSQGKDLNQIATGLMPEAAEPGNQARRFIHVRWVMPAVCSRLARGVYRICDISDAPVSVQAIDKFAEMLIH